MEILLAESMGFCMGVRRAIDLAQQAQTRAAAVVTLGPLIHNAQEMARLAAAGIQQADAATLPAQGAVVIRAHGVGPQAYQELRARGLRVLDGTCPYVHYSQRKAVELRADGYTVVIAGDSQHPEIRAILEHIDHQAHVVASVAEARALPAGLRIGTIAQTTLSPQKYQAIIAALREQARELKECATICDTTEQHQDAVRRLAAEVEMVYVVGDRHSANSKKLVEVAREHCPRALLVETAAEIKPEDVRGLKRVGISAGASAPDWLIEHIVARLRALAAEVAGSAR